MKKCVLLIILSLFSSVYVFSQAKEITRDEYYRIFRDSLKKYHETASRREISKTEYYIDGMIDSTTETITENIKPDRFRFVVIEKSSKSNSKSDLIKIGETYYCRKDDGEWKDSNSGCNNGWVSGLSNIVSSQFFVEKIRDNGKSYSLYKEHTLYKDTYSVNKDKKGLSYWDTKILIDEDNKLISEEIESGLVETNIINSRQLNKYEYDPKGLKIDAPIK